MINAAALVYTPRKKQIPGCWQYQGGGVEVNMVVEVNMKVEVSMKVGVNMSTSYLIFVIFLHSHIFSLKILNSKVRKFATKIASRQNSVNQCCV